MASHAIPIVYPLDIILPNDRKAYKQQLLKDRPETLFSDFYKNGHVCNLICYTDQPSAWNAAITAHYGSVKEEVSSRGWKLQVEEMENITTINVFKSGTILVQGNHKRLELDFPIIKSRAQQEKSAPTTTRTLPATDRTSTSSTDQPSEECEPSNPDQALDPHHSREPTRKSYRRELTALASCSGKALDPLHSTEQREDNTSHGRELTTQPSHPEHVSLPTALDPQPSHPEHVSFPTALDPQLHLWELVSQSALDTIANQECCICGAELTKLR